MGWEERQHEAEQQAPTAEALRRELVAVFGELRQMLGGWGVKYEGERERARRAQIAAITDTIEQVITGRRATRRETEE